MLAVGSNLPGMQSKLPPATDDAQRAAARRARHYRIAGLVSILLGLAGAGLIYGHGSHTIDASDDPAMVGFNRAEERQMGVLYGKQGQLIEDLNSSLKQPGTQALLLIAISAAIAGICFRFGHVLADEAKEAIGETRRPNS